MFGRNKQQDPPESLPTSSRPKAVVTGPAAARSDARPAPVGSPTPVQNGASATRPLPAQGHGSANRTVIGQTACVRGELTASEDILIEGSVEGRVVLPEHTLTIGMHAHVKAELWAKNVKIVGKVVGDVHASARIEVTEGGSVEGDLRAPKVVLGEGAIFKGNIDMVSNVPAPPAVSSPPRDAEPARAEAPAEAAPESWSSADAEPHFPLDKDAESEREPALAAVDAAGGAAKGAGESKKKNTSLAQVFGDFDPSNP